MSATYEVVFNLILAVRISAFKIQGHQQAAVYYDASEQSGSYKFRLIRLNYSIVLEIQVSEKLPRSHQFQ